MNDEVLVLKRCKDCGSELPLSAFHISARSKTGRPYYRNRCISCESARHLEYMHNEYASRTPRVPEYTLTHKRCYRCKETKPVSEFNLNHRKRKDGSVGYDSMCRDCRNQVRTEWTNAHPDYYTRYNGEYRRNSRLLRSYGLTVIEFETMVVNQDGRCLICGTVPDYPLYVDHNHDTGEVRGLLCLNCNSALGNLHDDVDMVLRAASYLRGELSSFDDEFIGDE